MVATGQQPPDRVRPHSLEHDTHHVTRMASGDLVSSPAQPRTEDPVIGYVSKFPPSPSGIGLYASVFEQALRSFGPVVRRPAPVSPRHSQRLRSALLGFARGWRDGRRRTFAAVHVELGGRSLYEFYYALGLLRTRRTRLSITCHDAPSLVGMPCLFAILDHKGVRRLGGVLSAKFGSRWEQELIDGSYAVLCLTQKGATALSRRYGHPAHAVPHAVDDPGTPRKTENRIFLPGYLSDPKVILEVVRRTTHYNIERNKRWRVVVGACPLGTVEKVMGQLTPREVELTTFVGYQSEEELLEEFRRARVVIRIRGKTTDANIFAASGPLAWAAARGCLVVTDDRRAGAQEMAHRGLIRYSPSPAEDLVEILEAALDPSAAATVAHRTQEFYGIESVIHALQIVDLKLHK